MLVDSVVPQQQKVEDVEQVHYEKSKYILRLNEIIFRLKKYKLVYTSFNSL